MELSAAGRLLLRRPGELQAREEPDVERVGGGGRNGERRPVEIDRAAVVDVDEAEAHARIDRHEIGAGRNLDAQPQVEAQVRRAEDVVELDGFLVRALLQIDLLLGEVRETEAAEEVAARSRIPEAVPRGYLLGGFGLAYFTEQKVDLEQGTNQETVQLDDVFGSTDLNLDLGLGIEIPAGPNLVTIDTRVGFGLLNINNGGTIDSNGRRSPFLHRHHNTFDIRFLREPAVPLAVEQVDVLLRRAPCPR